MMNEKLQIQSNIVYLECMMGQYLSKCCKIRQNTSIVYV